MNNLYILLRILSIISLFGISFSVAFVSDLSNITFFQIKVTFIFINTIFKEHNQLFRILKRISNAKRYNKKENVVSSLSIETSGTVLSSHHEVLVSDVLSRTLCALPNDSFLLGLECSFIRVNPSSCSSEVLYRYSWRLFYL